jgi:hypothetical protein
MDAAQALADLTEISSQIQAAIILDGDGSIVASTLDGPRGRELLVRDGTRTIAATTGPEPTVGLVFYDLKSCLRSVGGEEKPRPKPRPRRQKEKAESDAPA